MIIYFSIGLVLSCYWWNKSYDKQYEESKTSGEGVEEGMAVNHLLFMTLFWPLFLVSNLCTYKQI